MNVSVPEKVTKRALLKLIRAELSICGAGVVTGDLGPVA